MSLRARDHKFRHLHVSSKRRCTEFKITIFTSVNIFFFPLAASGSGSVIGRDPLPPRAVSTSHLPQRTLTQPPTAVSTLPLPRSSTGHRQPPLPLHRSTPQQQASMRQLDGETAAQMLRAVSNGDIVKGPGM